LGQGKQSGSRAETYLDANVGLPVYRADLNHPVNIAEHGNAASLARPRDRADLTARRVRRRSIGMTEEANTSGNALDMPTSVWSEMARKGMEPLSHGEKQMTANARWLMRPRTVSQENTVHNGCTLLSPNGRVNYPAVGQSIIQRMSIGLMRA